MNIIHVIFSFNTGGAETMLVDIINEQVKSEKVTLIIINHEINQALLSQINKNVNIILIGRKESSKNPIPILMLNWFLFINKPDVIHCHQQALIKIIILKSKAVLTVHAMGITTNNYKYFKKIFAISNAVKSDIEQRSNSKPVLVYNGIKIDQIKQKENYNVDTFRIVQVGRLDHEIKGQHILLEALKILVHEKEIKNICVDFIGAGESLDYLKSLVFDYQLENHVNFLGIRDRTYIYDHLKDYNLLVHPSIFEGFGLTIVEAMAAKIPVLVSNIDGPMEVINNGKWGWFFEPDNVHDCAKKILILIKTNISTSNKIDEAYKGVVSCFSIKATTNNYLKHY